MYFISVSACVGILIFIWAVRKYVKSFSRLQDGAKILYFFLLFTGVGTIPALIMLYMNIGFLPE